LLNVTDGHLNWNNIRDEIRDSLNSENYPVQKLLCLIVLFKD